MFSVRSPHPELVFKSTFPFLLYFLIILPGESFGEEASDVYPAKLFPCTQRGRKTTTLHIENDMPFNTDRAYTNGIRVTHQQDAGSYCPVLARAIPGYQTYDLGLVLGQNIYTPQDLRKPDPSPLDRPYAGWLYGGLIVQAATDSFIPRRLLLEVDIGVIGPLSGAGWIQRHWHALYRWLACSGDPPDPKGWSHQLPNEPALRISALTEAVFWRSRFADLSADVQGDIGNVFTSFGLGSTLRIGLIGRPFGLNRIAPSALPEPESSVDRRFQFYGYFRGQGRTIFRNVFLDGTMFRESPRVPKRPFVADGEIGLAIRILHFELQGGAVYRSPEMLEPYDDPDVRRGESTRYGQRYFQLQVSWLSFDS